MLSGDLEIHADDFFSNPDVTDVDISVRRVDTSEILPARKIFPGDDSVIVTAPLAAGSTSLEVSASALANGQWVEARPQSLTLLAGQDKRVDLCATGLILEADNLSLPADGNSAAIVTATLQTCVGEEAQIANQTVTFELLPAASAGTAHLVKTQATTSQRGLATTTVTAGTTPQADLKVRATVVLGSRTLVATLPLKTTPKLTIAYVWHQDTLDWQEGGSTRWTTATSSLPGLHVPERDQLLRGFVVARFRRDAAVRGLTRRGVLTGIGSTLSLTEQVDTNPSYSRLAWSISGVPTPLDCSPTTASLTSRWSVLPQDANHYQNYDLAGKVAVDDTVRELRLNGLRAVGELGYVNDLQPDPDTGFLPNCQYGAFRATVPPVLGAVRADVALVPRGDGSAIQYAQDLTQPVVFPRLPDGTFKPYSFCGTVEKDLTTQPGYRLPSPDPFFPTAQNSVRKTTYTPGDHPLTVGPGHITTRYRFAAVATYDTTPPVVSLPDCTAPAPPVVDFTSSPDDVAEGRVIQFSDLTSPSSDVSAWQWDFGDGVSLHPQPCSATSAVTCHIFPDNGTYTVSLTVTTTRDTLAQQTGGRAQSATPGPDGQRDAAGQPTGKRARPTVGCWLEGRGLAHLPHRVGQPGVSPAAGHMVTRVLQRSAIRSACQRAATASPSPSPIRTVRAAPRTPR